MVKRKPLVSIEKDETENGFSMHVLHERPSKHALMTALCPESFKDMGSEQKGRKGAGETRPEKMHGKNKAYRGKAPAEA